MKKYTLEATKTDGRFSIEGVSDGFNALEIIGILEWKIQDIIAQTSGQINPDIVKRTVIREEREESKNET